ncbi:restriction endonuclease [Corallococcus sp. Z5C101001]|uniref:restriction endonuclease n=1 Tax=Corallococcus sp. Z5C101001 TaxID=2596829 RepID=UPI00117F037F|nr:restriction endonuclease [Corallococcus sp. Z5C101001]TSC25859.1 restriction endonuclease [Corallococcus sp. Z5C101001]
MPVPDYQSLMLPLLERLADGQEHLVREVREEVALALRLSEAERTELLPSGKQAVFDNRLGWAKTYMDKAGLLRSVRRGVFQITERGKNVLDQKPAALDTEALLRFDGFKDFVTRGTEGDVADAPRTALDVPVDSAAITPEEALERAYKDLRKKTEAELLAATLQSSPRFFERLVVELLVKMGYGGSLEDAGKALGGSHDGGVDGMIKEDPLGLDVIYIQAKRWQNTVGRPDVQGFAGSLEGERARKGVFITTSNFSKEAREYVARIDKKIVLIDGARLSGLMFDFGIGVNAVGSYELKRVDSDFFSEE